MFKRISHSAQKYIPRRISINRRYFFNLTTTFLSQSVNALSIILITPVLVRNLGQSGFGWYGVLQNIIFSAAIFDFGLNIGMLRRLIHGKNEANSLVNALFFFFLSLFFLTLPVIFLLKGRSFEGNENNVFFSLCLVALVFVQNIYVLFFDTLIQTANKIYTGKLVRVIKLGIEFGLLYYCSQFGSVVLLLGISAILNLGYIYILFRLSKREVSYRISFSFFSFHKLWDHIRYSSWYFLSSVATVMVFYVQGIMIGYFLGTVVVAKYLLVSRFFDVIRVGLTNFTQVLFPKLVYIESEQKWDEIRRLFISVFTRIILLSGLSILLLLTIGETVFRYWSNGNDSELLHLYRLFAVFIGLIVIDNVSVVFLSALKFNKVPTIVSVCQGLLGLGLGYLLMKSQGIAGVATGSIIAFVCTNMIFNTVYLLRSINQKISKNANGYLALATEK
jgi:O-antigen/teichoic acid export membrane protein